MIYIPYFFISVWTLGCLFCTWGLIQYRISLLRLFQLWPLGALVFGPCVPFTYSHHCGIWVFFLTALPYFPVLQDSPDLSCMFPAPNLESAVSLRLLFIFIGKCSNFVELPNDLNVHRIPRSLLLESGASGPQQPVSYTQELIVFTLKWGLCFQEPVSYKECSDPPLLISISGIQNPLPQTSRLRSILLFKIRIEDQILCSLPAVFRYVWVDMDGGS